MVLLNKKAQPVKMKRSKSSHPILVSKSSQTFARQKSFAGERGVSKTPEKDMINSDIKMERMLMEAERSFERGEYENALVKFTQGAALKPYHEGFNLGVKKSHLAILNDLKGNGDSLRDVRDVDLRKTSSNRLSTDRFGLNSPNPKSLTLYRAWAKVYNQMEPKNKEVTTVNNSNSPKSQTLKNAMRMKKPEPTYNLTVHDGKDYKTISATAQDLKEYFKNKNYFKKMKKDASEEWKKFRQEMNKRVAEKEAALRYEREAKLLEEKSNAKRYCDEQVLLIGRHYQAGRVEDVIRCAENLVKYLNKKPDRTFPRKWVYLATAFNYLARAHTEQDDFETARLYGGKLYKIAINSRNAELIGQSYILSGKIYVKFKKYEEAAFVWEKLMPLIPEDEKKAWLFHEIGRCYYELGKYDTSFKYGLESKNLAEKCSSSTWNCSSSVLLGQIEMKKNKYREALDRFLEAKKHAQQDQDKHTINYIDSVENILNLALSKRNLR